MSLRVKSSGNQRSTHLPGSDFCRLVSVMRPISDIQVTQPLGLRHHQWLPIQGFTIWRRPMEIGIKLQSINGCCRCKNSEAEHRRRSSFGLRTGSAPSRQLVSGDWLGSSSVTLIAQPSCGLTEETISSRMAAAAFIASTSSRCR
jgi:hypothetical protein